MMTIDELLLPNPAHRLHASLPEMDPLTEEDALQEAQLLDVRFDALAGVVGVPEVVLAAGNSREPTRSTSKGDHARPHDRRSRFR